MKRKYQTVAMRPETYERLKAYKMGGSTYDKVLNQLMDALPLEEVSEAEIKEIRRRMRDIKGKGRDWREVRKELGDD
jgi:predicted CopG family antitoxin